MKRRLLRWARLAAKLAAAGWAVFAACWVLLPFPEDLLTEYPASTQWTDRDGNLLRLQLGPDDLDCRPVQFSETGDWCADALVAAEDKRFYQHPGVDPIAITRALRQNLTGRKVVSGASTISTQVIRLSEPRPRHLGTKVIEAFRGLQMEQRLSKEEILEQYLNRAPFGSNVVGVEAAARVWFGKSADQLTLAESSLLMGLPQSPARFQPDRHLDAALKRRTYVLGRLEANQSAEDNLLQQARGDQLEHTRRHPNAFEAPHFAELTRQLYPDRRGGTIATSLDPIWQARCLAVVRAHKARRQTIGATGISVVVVRVSDGQVLGLIGSPDWESEAHAGQVNVAWQPRSSGSTLKPLLVARAIDAGLVTPERILLDAPLALRDYTPGNADGHYQGPVSTREALVKSLNLPFLRLLRDYTPERLLPQLRAAGLQTLNESPETYGLSLVTGTAEVRLLQLANAYALFARAGRYRPFSMLRESPEMAESSWCSPEAAWLVSDMLSGGERSLQSLGHRGDARLPRFAWKTGTSMGHRDAWAVGWNPEVVVGVWMGRPDGHPVPGLFGADHAGPVLADLFRSAWPQGDGPWFTPPPGVVTETLCAASGCPAARHCADTLEGTVVRGRSDPTPCNGRFHPTTCAQTPVRPEGRDLMIEHPVNGTIYRLESHQPPPTLTPRVRGAQRDTVYWYVNGHPLTDAQWTLQPGTHSLHCATASGRTARSRVTVLAAD